MIAVRVAAAEILAAGLRRFSLAPLHGTLPPVSPGAHALLSLQADDRLHRRSYSILAAPADGSRYDIAVRLVSASRGGSAFLHRAVAVGDHLTMARPQNFFPPPANARAHLLIAGGIGITPFASWLRALAVPTELHVFCRADEAAAMRHLVDDDPRLTLHHARAELPGLLHGRPLGTHLSVCGPSAFMDAVQSRARDDGWPESKLHRENFGAATGAAFDVVLARSGRRIAVPENMPLLDALEAAGLSPHCLCRGGACGQCRVGVLAGHPDHRCHVLSQAERDAGDVMMICVSRARTAELVLDL